MKKKRIILRVVSLLLMLSISLGMFGGISVFAEETAIEQLADSTELWTPGEN